MPPLNFVCHPSILKIFMPHFFMPPCLYVFRKETQIQEGTLTFLAHFLMTQNFFLIRLFMPPSKKMKSFCHLQNPYATIFMPPWGWHKKKGGWHKKKTNAPPSSQKMTSFFFWNSEPHTYIFSLLFNDKNYIACIEFEYSFIERTKIG